MHAYIFITIYMHTYVCVCARWCHSNFPITVCLCITKRHYEIAFALENKSKKILKEKCRPSLLFMTRNPIDTHIYICVC